jgi:hypothetical protein
MKAAAALLSAAFAAAGCSSGAERSEAAIKVALDQFGKEMTGGPLCLHPSFLNRNPAAIDDSPSPMVWVEPPAPKGFETLGSQSPAPGALTPQAIAGRLPPRWYLNRGGDDLCFEFTLPVVSGDRAAVSVEAEEGRTLLGRRTYWLRWRGDRWIVEAKTEGYSDI